jgi:pyruvoyl-dependent arginine decarboxylase (PvlArgDC)
VNQSEIKVENNDMVRVIANKSLHKFEVGEIVAIVSHKHRKDGSMYFIAVGAETADRKADDSMWGVTAEEIEMYEKGGLLREMEGDSQDVR